jgi:hypothetical protein
MKKSYAMPVLAILFAAILSISSCKKDDLVVPYDLGNQTVCVDPNPYQGYITYTTNTNHNDVQAVLTAAGVKDLNRLTKAALRTGFKATVSATGVATTLDEISSIEVYIKETGTSGDGTQIAYSPTIANGATEIQLNLNGTDLKDVVTKDMTLTVKVLNKASGNTQKACLTLTNGIVDVSVKQ